MGSWKLIQKANAILERERGTVLKPWGGRISICLIYPNSYHVGMSNLGFQTLYSLFNTEEDVVCERAFLPEKEEFEEHQRSETPLFSLESQKPISEFDLLAFSISFENDYLNILSIFELGRIPLLSQNRGERDPLVIGGGVSVFLNPEPISPFFDLFILGEAEEVIKEFLEVFRKWRDRRGGGKEDLLRDVSKVEGVYIPKLYQVIYKEDGRIEAMIPGTGIPRKVKRRWIKEINQFPTHSVLFTPDTEFKEIVLVEMNRGCPRGCRFCAAYSAYYPFRNRSLSVLDSLIQEALLKGNRIGLTGTAVSDHPQLVSLCQSILSKQGKISTSSLRVDAIHPSLIQCLKEAQERTLSIAPEAGSERLRKILGKDYTEEEILRAIEILVENGIFQIKNYFLIGIPSETDEDVKGILILAKKIRHRILSKRKGQEGRWRLVLSLNPFVPKPATPFQWAPMERVGELKRRLKIVQQGIERERGMKLIHDLPKWAFIQALLSRGDRRVSGILMSVHRYQGDWSRALRETNLNPDFYVYRPRDLDEIFPWDFIDHGIPKEKLKEEYLKAMREAGVKI
jgi:radical SAM family uncharacterized protein